MTPEPYSEADTRQRLIDGRLRLAGWDLDDPTQVIQELDIYVAEGPGAELRERVRPPYAGHQFADYALVLRGKPTAVIEAKKTSRDAELGQEQAKQYAEQLQRMNHGPLPFVMYTNGFDTFFWDSEQYPPIKVMGFPTRDDLEWLAQRRETRGVLTIELINTRIVERDYQVEGIRAVLEAIEVRRRRFLMAMATGTGKTRVAAALVDTLMRAHWVKRVLFLVDRIALQEQAIQAFKEHLPAVPYWPRDGDTAFARDRRVYVTTYPTMLNSIHAGTTPATWISPFFFDLIIADESHRSIYNTYQQVVRYFHGLTLGLTATPRDHVEHDTFALFDCSTGDPTFAYGFEEAVRHDPPYLCDFEVLKVRTKFQVEGIRGPELDDQKREQLVLEGLDPDAIDFEGTDLEQKVTNSGSNAVIVRELMEEAIKDPSGTLPGKTIVFAVSVKHARRLQELFDQLYPEHRGRLARVLVADDSRVHGKGGLLDQFKTRDMPRVAISVDMLDTGVDIREVVNLVFAKPVYSYVKFWQMIGRGTRVLDPTLLKPWCPEKDRFLIIDCWANFEYFELNARGREPGQQVPMPVRLFRARLDQLEAALARPAAEIGDALKADLRADLAVLPANNVVVLEHQAEMSRVRDDGFWTRLGADDLRYLRGTIAPILRAKSDADFKALRFETDVVELGTALLAGNREAADTLRDAIIEQVEELPLGVNLVARERELIEAVLTPAWWAAVDDAGLRRLVLRLAPLMRFRQERRDPMLSLNLADVTAVRVRIVTGPDGRDMPIAAYRQRVEEAVRALLAENLVLQRIQAGAAVSEGDLRDLAELLRRQDPGIDEERLRRAYDLRTASFVRLLRHVLGVEPLERWSTHVSRRFEEFIAAHTTYTALQIRFLQTLRTFILQRGRVERPELLEAPFTQLHPQGVRGVFPARDIDEILRLTGELAA
ncbi:MAG TPA: DEAD/DEAH box helicase family protein [Gemmatimonadales bacterium]|nr:DEAD/DEAH box helicase family protein [Gemmatimonadales bacterium]